MLLYLGGKDASSCIIQLSTEDPDSQKDQTTNLPSLHDFVVSLTISPPISRGGGGGHSHTLPIWVCAAQRGRDFEAPDLERGIHFRGVF